VIHLFGEYFGEADPAIHASAIRTRGDWIPGLVDPTGNGRGQADGERWMQMCRKLGLKIQAIESPLESGI
jgi:hypothetical protein